MEAGAVGAEDEEEEEEEEGSAEEDGEEGRAEELSKAAARGVADAVGHPRRAVSVPGEVEG